MTEMSSGGNAFVSSNLILAFSVRLEYKARTTESHSCVASIVLVEWRGVRVNAIHFRCSNYQLGPVELQEGPMLVGMAIDECLYLLHFVVRQVNTTQDVGSNLTWITCIMQGRTHVEYGYFRRVLRTGQSD